VCVCTYKRALYLSRLLEDLGRQETRGLFTFSIVVVDNDELRSAEPIVTAFAARAVVAVKDCVEPRQNIALARNLAVGASTGHVAFIDDDEFPTPEWLLTLFMAAQDDAVDGVLGPVVPHFDEQPPEWVVRGRFYERPRYPTGFVIDWQKGRTGNVLLKKHLFEPGVEPFRPEFLTGEDQDFFGRMIEKGYRFIWCNEALAYEVVPPGRWRRGFMLRRAMLRGATSLVHPASGLRDIAKSLIAVPTYAAGLPVALLFGQERFMALSIKLCDHLGRVLAFVGITPVKEPYVTE
jgi:succinoglycan biosynthesis protein ExoM